MTVQKRSLTHRLHQAESTNRIFKVCLHASVILKFDIAEKKLHLAAGLPLTDVPLSTLLTESTPPHSVEHMAFVPAPLSLQQAPAKCFKDRLDC